MATYKVLVSYTGSFIVEADSEDEAMSIASELDSDECELDAPEFQSAFVIDGNDPEDEESGVEECPICHNTCNSDAVIKDHGMCFDCFHRRYDPEWVDQPEDEDETGDTKELDKG